MLGACAVLAVVVVRNVPLEFWGTVLPCPLRSATGIPCLGCGLTRALYRLAQGDVTGALHANPLGALVFVGLLLWAFWTLLRAVFPLPELPATLGGARARALAPAALGGLLALNYAWVLATHLG